METAQNNVRTTLNKWLTPALDKLQKGAYAKEIEELKAALKR